MLKQAGFFGTGASFGADLALMAEIVFFVALCLGVVVQRRGNYKLHDRIQTPVVMLNLVLIIFIMVASFLEQRVASTLPQRPTDPYYLVVAIHAGLGLVAEGLAIYCLLAGFKILPRRIGRLRYWMWTTFGFWLVTVAFGLGTYYVWYLRQPATVAVTTPLQGEQAESATQATDPAIPSSRQVLLQNFAFAPAELTVVVGTKVIWVNHDGAPHNITFVDESVASDNFFQGETFELTFDTLGTYQIYCSLHGNADGSGMATTVTVVEATEENIAQVEAIAAAPTPIPPTPTPLPTVPPAPVALIEPEEPEQVVVGLVSFFDNAAPSDSVNILLHSLAAPPANAELYAWLTDSRSNQRLNLGQIQPDNNGSLFHRYIDDQQRNLMDRFDGFEITQEPQFDDDPTPGPVLYSGRQTGQAMAAIRSVTVQAADPPGQQAYALGARQQTEELIRHVAYVERAYDLLSIADAQRHSEHVVNLLEGEQGQFFGDLDGLHGVQNPGDGFGIIPYVTEMNQAAIQASQAGDATEAIKIHSEHVVLAADNALNWATMVREAALQILATDNVGDIGPQVETLNRYSNLLLNGEDTNDDGEIAPQEGGIFTAYQHAQYMAAIGVTTVVDSGTR